MIIEGLLSVVFNCINWLFSTFSVTEVPTACISLLFNLMSVGVWVVGPTCFGLVMTTILFWMTFKLTAGVILFVWRLLPLT